MNEMNNGGNGYYQNNNQNVNNQFNGYNANNQNYNGREFEPKKKNNILVIVLSLIILGLVAFVVYDKLSKKEIKEENNDTPISVKKELVKYNKNQFSEKTNVSENDITYNKILTYKNGDLVLDFKIYYDVITTDESIGYTKGKIEAKFYINNVFINEIIDFTKDYCDKSNPNYATCEENLAGEYDYYSVDEVISSMIDDLKNNFGTIKSDKTYLYMVDEGYFKTAYANSFVFINEEGKILSSDIKYITKFNEVDEISFKNDCKSFAFGKKKDDLETRYGRYFILENEIYYFNLHGKTDDEICYNNISECQHHLTDEYKITIEKDVVKNEKINSCYIDMSSRY